MATPRAEFLKLAGASPIKPVPEFPKLPECIRKRFKKDELREIDEWDAKVAEFFKQDAQRKL